MGILFVSEERHRQLQHFRRRTWLLIGLCLLARGTDAALGLGLIEPTHQFADQGVPPLPANPEHRV